MVTRAVDNSAARAKSPEPVIRDEVFP